MTATNMCSNFGSKWSSPPLLANSYIHLCSHQKRLKHTSEAFPEAMDNVRQEGRASMLILIEMPSCWMQDFPWP